MINEIMREYVQAEEEVHLEPQPEKITNVKPETQPEEEEQAVEERANKRKRTSEQEKKGETKEEEDFPICRIYRRKGFLETDFPVCRINREEGMGVLL